MALGKIALYFHSIKTLPVAMVWNRFKKKFRLPRQLKQSPQKQELAKVCSHYRCPPSMASLDFDPSFLERYSIDALMANRFSFLHSEEVEVDLDGFQVEGQDDLWIFNLHYFDYLLPLAKAYLDTKNTAYLEKIKELITKWILTVPKEHFGHEAYATSLRLLNWIYTFTYLEEAFTEDDAFFRKFMESIQEQYLSLAQNLELHLMANHLFENYKALCVCSYFLNDKTYFQAAYRAFLHESKEQVQADGMHYERSFMYHNIMLDLHLRVFSLLSPKDTAYSFVEKQIQKMLTCSLSFCLGGNVPLFNDSGNNVARSLDALLATAKSFAFDTSKKISYLESSGFLLLEEKESNLQLIVDVGAPGPHYNPAHSHAEIMSFALYHENLPLLVNAGTYLYQAKDRAYYRSGDSHNTLRALANDQTELWGNFRLGRRAKIKSLEVFGQSVELAFEDYKGNTLCRNISLENGKVELVDRASTAFSSAIHFHPNAQEKVQVLSGKHESRTQSIQSSEYFYAEDFGKKEASLRLHKEAREKSEDFYKITWEIYLQ